VNLKEKLNYYGSKKEPFFFIINYDMSKYDLIPLDSLPNNITYKITKNCTYKNHNCNITAQPIPFNQYNNKFLDLQTQIRNGNTYLANLTTQTIIQTNTQLKKLYDGSFLYPNLYYKDKFICFSPEEFCHIEDNKIYTYPMKGTVDASLSDASEKILADKKEMAEHIMIVDLLRNDLNMVAKDVKVDKFRYVTKISAGDKKLLQVSSKISGKLENNWQDNLGEILKKLLPAGSITGTPKKSTVDIIKSIEDYNRGFYSGIFGVFDGNSLDSAVMIRYIENIDNKLFYKSGGGITLDSNVALEYKELIDKIYI